jgi:hypothetical protein
MTKIELTAIAIALFPPIKANKYSRAAYVDWELIDRLRAALDDAGVDWKAAKAEYERVRRVRKGTRTLPLVI